MSATACSATKRSWRRWGTSPSASDARDAIAAVRAEPARFDAILVSQASAQAALDLARALHALAPRKPILLAARSAVDVGADALVRAGIADVVRRPIASPELAAALSRSLRSAARLQM
jgi:CheY-like chemotaxis protein